jgi:hypothetical protein
MSKLTWEKNFVVYHVKSGALIKAFDLVSSAKRGVTCSNRNAGVNVYAYASWDQYWQLAKS